MLSIEDEHARLVWEGGFSNMNMNGEHVKVLDEGLFGPGGQPTTGHWDFKEACASHGEWQFWHGVAIVACLSGFVRVLCA